MQKSNRTNKVFGSLALVYLVACSWTLLAHNLFGQVLWQVALCWLASLAVMGLLFIVSTREGRYDYVDVGWGLSFMTIALVAFWTGDKDVFNPVRLMVLALVLLWGSRLSSHIYARLRRSSAEDSRYVELRSRWAKVTKSTIFMRIFFVQSFLALFVGIAVIHILSSVNVEWSWWTTFGLAVWLVGFGWEVVADRQLRSFLAKKPNRGKLMTSGLWAYSRHPNYFGEILLWWGISIIALGTPHGWAGLGGATLITYLIMFVSGVPLAEKSSANKPGWQEYARKTPVLLPKFIK